jgi:hypothetical protein
MVKSNALSGSSPLTSGAHRLKRDRTTEDRVVGAVWEELGGVLVEQFRVPSDRPRYLDALIVEAPDRAILSPNELPDIGGSRVWAVEVKSGAVDMGVLGQALFGAELARIVMPEAEVLPLAAAPDPPTESLRRVLDHFRPRGLEWRAYPRVRREGKPQRSSGEPNPPDLPAQMLDWYAARAGGMLVRVGARRTRRDFCSVTVKGTGESLSPLGLSGLLLTDRPSAVVLSDDAVVEVSSGERVELIHTCTDLYRTQMGKALFSTEVARQIYGLQNALGIALFRRDNRALRALFGAYPQVRAVPFGER